MLKFFERLRTRLSKPILFGIYGGLGCLLVDILMGEKYLDLMEPLLESGQSISFWAFLLTSGWIALITLGIAAPLIIGQNHYLRRRLLTFREAGLIVGGSLIVGLISEGTIDIWSNQY